MKLATIALAWAAAAAGVAPSARLSAFPHQDVALHPRAALLPRSTGAPRAASMSGLSAPTGARLSKTAARASTVSMSAAQLPMPAMRAFTRLALMLATTLLVLSLRAGRALAVTAAKQSSGALVSGTTLKWAGLAVVMGGMFVFRTEETPILTETVVEEDERPAVSARDLMDEDDFMMAAPGDAPPAAAEPASFDVDDSSIHSALFGRMQELAAQRATEEQSEPAAEEPPSDSTDGWGEGSTAVLEPPKPGSAEGGGLLDGVPNNPIGEGFPIVDPPEPPPLASDEQVEMMKRMFG